VTRFHVSAFTGVVCRGNLLLLFYQRISAVSFNAIALAASNVLAVLDGAAAVSDGVAVLVHVVAFSFLWVAIEEGESPE
jgi:hypothetical protein